MSSGVFYYGCGWFGHVRGGADGRGFGDVIPSSTATGFRGNKLLSRTKHYNVIRLFIEAIVVGRPQLADAGLIQQAIPIVCVPTA